MPLSAVAVTIVIVEVKQTHSLAVGLFWLLTFFALGFDGCDGCDAWMVMMPVMHMMPGMHMMPVMVMMPYIRLPMAALGLAPGLPPVFLF